jgi:hypothetical protein
MRIISGNNKIQKLSNAIATALKEIKRPQMI